MKKIYGFAALAAALALTSCSNDEPVNNGPTPNNEPVAKGYVTVSLATPAATGSTRADEENDGKYVHGSVVGTVDESKVSNALLITFKDGYAYEVVEFTPKPWYTSAETGVDKESSTNIIEVTVPTKTEGEGDAAVVKDDMVDEFITVLNVPAGDLGVNTISANTTGDSMETVRKKLANYSSTTNGLVMSTSAFNDEAETNPKNVYSTSIEGKIFKDLADASKESNIIKVYVERAVARIDYGFKSTDGGFTKTPNANLILNENLEEANEEANLDFTPTITVTGVSIANLPDKTYLVKNVDDFSTWTYGENANSGFAYNIGTLHRSHWADCAPLANGTEDEAGEALVLKMQNKSYGDITDNKDNSALTDITGSFEKASIYAHENTTTQPTAVIITARIGDGTDLYRLVVNGKYYSGETNAKTAALGYLENDKYFKKVVVNEDGKDVEHYVSIAAGDLEIKGSDDHRYDGYIQFANSLKGNVYKGSTDAATGQMKFDLIVDDSDAENMDKALAKANAELKAAEWKSKREENGETIMLKKYRVYRWNQGKCYYFTNIHPEYVDKDGVVRNHIYDLKLNSVVGLGIPVFNPSDEIIPEIPDKIDPKDPDNYFVRASIYMLDWTYYSQDVSFETPDY